MRRWDDEQSIYVAFNRGEEAYEWQLHGAGDEPFTQIFTASRGDDKVDIPATDGTITVSVPARGYCVAARISDHVSIVLDTSPLDVASAPVRRTSTLVDRCRECCYSVTIARRTAGSQISLRRQLRFAYNESEWRFRRIDE